MVLLSMMSPRPWAQRRSFRRPTSSFSSRTRRLLGSSLITALQRICLALSAYLHNTQNCYRVSALQMVKKNIQEVIYVQNCALTMLLFFWLSLHYIYPYSIMKKEITLKRHSALLHTHASDRCPITLFSSVTAHQHL